MRASPPRIPPASAAAPCRPLRRPLPSPRPRPVSPRPSCWNHPTLRPRWRRSPARLGPSGFRQRPPPRPSLRPPPCPVRRIPLGRSCPGHSHRPHHLPPPPLRRVPPVLPLKRRAAARVLPASPGWIGPEMRRSPRSACPPRRCSRRGTLSGRCRCLDLDPAAMCPRPHPPPLPPLGPPCPGSPGCRPPSRSSAGKTWPGSKLFLGTLATLLERLSSA